VVADFNRDGLPDLAMGGFVTIGGTISQPATSRGGLSVLLGSRSAPFTALTELPAGFRPGEYYLLLTAEGVSANTVRVALR
jgi:hypothetical protein